MAELRLAREKARARGKPELLKDVERLDRNNRKLEESRLEYKMWVEQTLAAIRATLSGGHMDLEPIVHNVRKKRMGGACDIRARCARSVKYFSAVEMSHAC